MTATPVYATVSDVQAAAGSRPLPADDDLALTVQVASDRVDEMVMGAVYDTDSTGAPTDADVVDALRRAVVAQVLWQVEQGDDTGMSAGMVMSQIGGEQWEKSPSAATSRLGTFYAPNAVTILRLARLLPICPRRY